MQDMISKDLQSYRTEYASECCEGSGGSFIPGNERPESDTFQSGHVRIGESARAASICTAQNLNSGIFPYGSSLSRVSTLAGASKK